MLKNETEKEFLTLSFLIKEIWSKKVIISTVVFIVTIVSVIYALNVPNVYKSTVVLAPNEQEQAGALSGLASQFGGIASLAGVNLEQGSNKSKLAIELLKSHVFLSEFITKFDLKADIFASINWHGDKNKFEYDTEIYNENKSEWVREVDFPYKPEPDMQEVVKKFKEESLIISQDEESGLFYLSVLSYSPYFAKGISDLLVKEINNYMKVDEISRTEKSIHFLQNSVKETSNAEVKTVFFQLIQQQYQKKMLAETQEDFVFRVVDPSIVPLEKYKPSRALIVLGFIFGALFISVAIVVFRVVLTYEKNRNAK